MSRREIRYRICNAEGTAVAVHVRRDFGDGSKTFVWELPDGTCGLGGLPLEQLPLYGAEDIREWGAEEPVLVVEGEKARDALKCCGIRALATVTGALSCPGRQAVELLRGRAVILWPDNDEPGRAHMRRLVACLDGVAASLSVFEWRDAPNKGDAANYVAVVPDANQRLKLELEGARAASEIEWAKAPPTTAGGIVAAALEKLNRDSSQDDRVAGLRDLVRLLARSDALERAAARQEAIKHLTNTGVAPRDATELVRAALRETREPGPSPDKGTGSALELVDPVAWPDQVDGAGLANEIERVVRRYIVLSSDATRAVVLWIFFSYLLNSVDVAPRLLITSPIKACGKTRLLSLLGALARRALMGSSITPAAVFRAIEAHAPTLILDEVDNLGLSEKPELLAVLNSGHTRGTASAIRVVGDSHEVQSFSTWCPIALAGIRTGALPDTVTSRAIRVQLVRKRKVEKVQRMREAKLYRELEPLRQQLMRWVTDHGTDVGEAEPAIPEELDGRGADNWSVLIAIADALGGEWPAYARTAALVLETGGSPSDSIGEGLLADVRHLFEERACDRLSSEAITSALAQLEGHPWAEWGKQRKPLSKNQLARLLKEFEIESGSIRLSDGTTAKGYYRVSFGDAWERYLPAKSIPETSQRHGAGTAHLELDLETSTSDPAVTDRNCAAAASSAARDGVTVQTPITGDPDARAEDAAEPAGMEESPW